VYYTLKNPWHPYRVGTFRGGEGRSRTEVKKREKRREKREKKEKKKSKGERGDGM